MDNEPTAERVARLRSSVGGVLTEMEVKRLDTSSSSSTLPAKSSSTINLFVKQKGIARTAMQHERILRALESANANLQSSLSAAQHQLEVSQEKNRALEDLQAQLEAKEA